MRTPISCRRSRHALSDDAIEPDRSQKHGRAGEDRKHDRRDAAPAARLPHDLFDRAVVENRHRTIEIADGRFDRGTGDRAPRARDRKYRRPRLLHDRHEDLLRRVLIEAVLLDVADNADDRCATGRSPRSDSNLPA